jgi:hypothetical protein
MIFKHAIIQIKLSPEAANIDGASEIGKACRVWGPTQNYIRQHGFTMKVSSGGTLFRLSDLCGLMKLTRRDVGNFVAL